jgi:hypothetical protein
MKTHSPSDSLWMPLTKAGLVIAMGLALAQVQATPNEAAPARTAGASQGDAVKPPAKTPVAKPHRHSKEVTLAPVKPQSYPSNPLPPLPRQR